MLQEITTPMPPAEVLAAAKPLLELGEHRDEDALRLGEVADLRVVHQRTSDREGPAGRGVILRPQGELLEVVDALDPPARLASGRLQLGRRRGDAGDRPPLR